MKLNKKMIIMLSSVMIVILLVIIITLLLVGGKSKNLSYSDLEDKIATAGEAYYIDNPSKLPEAGTDTIDVSVLVSNGYMRDLSKYTKKGVTCSGKLHVTKIPNGYSYKGSVDCGNNYATGTLFKKLTSTIVTSGNGLYEEEQVDPMNPDTTTKVYVFKGEKLNNNIKVGDYIWQVVKIFEDGRIQVLGSPELARTLWDDRYNTETGHYYGINDYEVSRVKDFIQSQITDTKDTFLKIKRLITTHNACIGKRALDDTSRDGSAECSEILENQYFTLLPTYDYMNASLDGNCVKALDDSCYNYNYILSDFYDEWWTITGVSDNNEDVYYVRDKMEVAYPKTTRGLRLVAYLDPNVSYVSGTGTFDDPYIVK